MKATLTLCSVVGPLLWVVPATADHWPHWRGEAGNGVSTTADPPIRWSDTENVKWKVAIPGRSSGSPVVWDDRVFVVTAVATDGQSRANSVTQLQFKLLCFNRPDGKLRWERSVTTATPHQETHETNSYASASPCTDGELVFAHFGSRGLYCYTLDGQTQWQRTDLGKMQTRLGFGEGSSPTIAGDLLIVPWDHEGPSYLLALDKRTGKTVWKVDRDEPTGWSTPLIVAHDGKQQIIMNGQNAARAYDLETGEELWRCAGQTERPAASAVADRGIVYIASGFRGAFLGAFRLDGQGDIEGSDKVVWTFHRDTPDIASPLLSNGRLYFYKDKNGVISCLDAATGEPHYLAQRVPGLSRIYASPIAANGYVYLTDRDGTTVVIKDSDQFEIVATNSVGETVDATPSPVDDELFIRGQEHLFCVKDEGKGEG